MPRFHFLLALCSIALVACASAPKTGIMVAQWDPSKKSGESPQKVMIAWHSESSLTGSMTFTLGPGGQRYVGPYLLLEKTVAHMATQPFYDAWDSASFRGWGAGGIDPWFEPGWGMSVWVNHYDGRVVSTLQGNRGGSARCHFTLKQTNLGVAGGGTGQCQVSDGGLLDATF